MVYSANSIVVPRFSGSTFQEGALSLSGAGSISISQNGHDFVISGTSGGTGLTSLNGSTSGTQTFSTATSGTDFNISTSGSVHFFSIPNASATARGLMSTAAQTFSGSKTFGDDVILSNANPFLGTNTTDGADNKVLALSSATTAGDTRGARLLVFGNEHSNKGLAFLACGDATTGVNNDGVRLYTPGNQKIQFWTNATWRAYFDNTGHFVPVTDNTYDMGDGNASFRWRTVYCYQLSGPNFTLGVTNGTFTFGTTTTSNIIRNSTGDSGDNAYIRVCGGGGEAQDRGAAVFVAGNEHATNPGEAVLRAGDTGSGKVQLHTLGSQPIEFWTNNTKRAFFTTAGALALSTSTSGVIATDTASGSDSKQLVLAGAGNPPNTRGASIYLNGNQFTSSGGAIQIEGGSTSSGNITLLCNGSANSIFLGVDGSNKIAVSGNDFRPIVSSGANLGTASRPWNGISVTDIEGPLTSPIRIKTINASAIEFHTNTGSTGATNLQWAISSAGNLASQAAANGLVESVATALAGTGTTQAGATAITSTLNEVTTLTAAVNEAFVLPTSVVGKSYTVFNAHATAAAKIFPPSSGQIDALGTDNSYSIAAGASKTFSKLATNQWYTS